MITELNERSREIFRFIVDAYLETGQPVGSRTISKGALLGLSPASIRNTMADLEAAGLLCAPHASAGRLPTEAGLRLYIDGLMEIGGLGEDERRTIENTCLAAGRSLNEILDRSSSLLSGLSACASIVIAPKTNESLKHIQFVKLAPGRILIVLVLSNGLVENRIMDTPRDIPESSLIKASNYLNAKLGGKTLAEAQKDIMEDINRNRTQLDEITQDLVKKGLALPQTKAADGHIIVRGQSRLLEDVKAIAQLERARALLGYLEEQENMLKLLDSVGDADGVQIFIGAENKIFDQSGWSMIISPYRNGKEQIIGAIGVIGPTRLNYDRIIPMVDYTAQIVAKLVDEL
ncbi:MAG TPA: heat-inducible transcriptional repressor HrcA [Rhodospirillaceae bacterium]|nr:heat-inducible transcriptional repressor HrcA [Rhodospirillaceae bacterium]